MALTSKVKQSWNAHPELLLPQSYFICSLCFLLSKDCSKIAANTSVLSGCGWSWLEQGFFKSSVKYSVIWSFSDWTSDPERRIHSSVDPRWAPVTGLILEDSLILNRSSWLRRKISSWNITARGVIWSDLYIWIYTHICTDTASASQRCLNWLSNKKIITSSQGNAPWRAEKMPLTIYPLFHLREVAGLPLTPIIEGGKERQRRLKNKKQKTEKKEKKKWNRKNEG